MLSGGSYSAAPYELFPVVVESGTIYVYSTTYPLLLRIGYSNGAMVCITVVDRRGFAVMRPVLMKVLAVLVQHVFSDTQAAKTRRCLGHECTERIRGGQLPLRRLLCHHFVCPFTSPQWLTPGALAVRSFLVVFPSQVLKQGLTCLSLARCLYIPCCQFTASQNVCDHGATLFRQRTSQEDTVSAGLQEESPS